jgi:hypothetical protein
LLESLQGRKKKRRKATHTPTHNYTQAHPSEDKQNEGGKEKCTSTKPKAVSVSATRWK